MRARSSLTPRQRDQLVILFETGLRSQAAATRLHVNRDAVRTLERRWKLHGRLCLVEYPSKRTYPFEVKKEVVARFLAGETVMELASVFQLSSDRVVQTWVRAWRAGGDDALMPKPKGRPKGTPAPVAEEEQLRRQVRRLEAENAYLKKLRDLRDQGHA